MIFIVSQVVIIGIGLLPVSLWRSFRVAKPAMTPAKGAKAGAPQPAVT
jgi:hypothetical protein